MPSLLLTRFGFYQKAYTFVFVTKGKDCHQHHLLLCMLLRLRREKIRNLLTKKMRKNKFQKSQFLKKRLFWEIEFSMPNFITQCLRCPKMEKSRLGFNFVIHDYEQNHGQWFLKFRSTYLTSQVIKLFTTSATILQKTYLVSTKSLRKWSTYPT